MDEILHDDSDTLSAESPSKSLTSASTLTEWKEQFDVFDRLIDKLGMRFWYSYTIGSSLLFLVIAKVLIPPYFPAFSVVHSFVVGNVWLILAFEITIALTALTYNLWRANIPETFLAVLAKGRLSSKKEDGDCNAEYLEYLNSYQRELWSNRTKVSFPYKEGNISVPINRKYLLIALIIGTFVLFIVPVIPYFPSSPLLILDNRWLVAILVMLIPAGIIGYYLGVSAWTMYITGRYIHNLLDQFDLNIEASHPDGCGGLRFLGNFTLSLALPILVGILFFGIYALGAALFPNLIHGQKIDKWVAYGGIILFDLPQAAFAFFVPLWRIHKIMAKQKEKYEDKFSHLVSTLEKQLWDALEGKDLQKAKDTKDEIDALQALNPATIDYPAWPFDRRILLYYLFPQLLPILTLVITALPLLMPAHK